MTITTLPSILPSQQNAIIANDEGELEVRHEVPMPVIAVNCVLVKVLAAALNPVDTKMVRHLATPGATSGFDFAGVVAGYGEEVTEWPMGMREKQLHLSPSNFMHVNRHAALRIEPR